MATTNRGTESPLARDLFECGFRYDMFQAVWNFQRMFHERKRVGRDGPPSAEVVRFRSWLSLAFPPSAIRAITKPDRDDQPIEMTVALKGLTGTQGVLPSYYTELLLERTAAKQDALRDFLDLFNHRMISLFYRVWEKHRMLVGYEQGMRSGLSDPMSNCLWALLGLGTKGLRESLGGMDRALLRYTGLIAQRPHSAAVLQHILADYFHVPITIRQFVGIWLQIETEDQSCIGDGNRNNRLGHTVVLGTRVWDPQAKFTIRVGPLTYREFSRFLPSDPRYFVLVNLTKMLVDPTLDFSITLVCKRQEVPYCRLSISNEYTPQLGWTTWLKSKETRSDDEQVQFPGTARYTSTSEQAA